jgi:hypothetical protein
MREMAVRIIGHGRRRCRIADSGGTTKDDGVPLKPNDELIDVSVPRFDAELDGRERVLCR